MIVENIMLDAVNKLRHAQPCGGIPDFVINFFGISFRQIFPIYAQIAVADHIEHAIDLVGIDHVGLGSDFDGAGPTMPTGLRDVSDFPNLILELLERGYSEEEIAKVCGGNLLRVWSDVERMAGG